VHLCKRNSPPSVPIYKGESHDLIDSWVEDFNKGD
jgi:hypothetical protein